MFKRFWFYSNLSTREICLYTRTMSHNKLFLCISVVTMYHGVAFAIRFFPAPNLSLRNHRMRGCPRHGLAVRSIRTDTSPASTVHFLTEEVCVVVVPDTGYR